MLRTVLTAAVCLLAGPVVAQVCLFGPPEILDKLLDRNGQEPLIQMQIGAPNSPTAPALLTVSPDGSFTLWALAPDGSICIVAAGLDALPAEGRTFPKPIIPGEDS